MKKPTTKKTANKPKSKPAANPKPTKQAASKAAIGDNSADPRVRELFLVNKSKIDAQKKKADKAISDLRALYKAAKGDGFEKFMFDVARQLETPEGETKYLTELNRHVEVAKFIGNTAVAKIEQLDLFGNIDRTDATERAYDEGQKASMESKAAKPGYAPGTAQYEAYMKGFHDHQAGIAKGFQSIDKGAKTAKAEKAPKPPRASEAAKDDAPAIEPPATPTIPASGQPISRAEYARLQEQQNGQAAPQSQFQRA